MYKLIIGVLIIAAILTIFTPAVLSQSFFGEPTKTTTAPSGGSQPNPVISPSDFGNLVNSLDKKTKKNLAQEANQQLRKQQSNLPMNMNPTNAENNPAVNTNVESTQMPPPLTNKPVNQPPAEIKKVPPAVSGTTPQQQVAPPTSEPQVYTGFGTEAPKNNDTTTNPPANSGGWNIRY